MGQHVPADTEPVLVPAQDWSEFDALLEQLDLDVPDSSRVVGHLQFDQLRRISNQLVQALGQAKARIAFLEAQHAHDFRTIITERRQRVLQARQLTSARETSSEIRTRLKIAGTKGNEPAQGKHDLLAPIMALAGEDDLRDRINCQRCKQHDRSRSQLEQMSHHQHHHHRHLAQFRSSRAQRPRTSLAPVTLNRPAVVGVNRVSDESMRLNSLRFANRFLTEETLLLRKELESVGIRIAHRFGNDLDVDPESDNVLNPTTANEDITVQFHCQKCQSLTPHLLISDLKAWQHQISTRSLQAVKREFQYAMDQMARHHTTVQSQLAGDVNRLQLELDLERKKQLEQARRFKELERTLQKTMARLAATRIHSSSPATVDNTVY